MKIFIQIVTSFVFAYWPILMMTSVMIFDSPGSTDNKKAILLALSLAFIPVLIGLLYFFFNQTFWGIKPKTLLIITIIVSVLGSLLFGYPKLLLNNSKGISSNGYFIKEDKVYYEGDLTEAKAFKFEAIDQFQIYARDAEAVYFRGKKIPEAIASSFKAVLPQSSYFTDNANIFYEGKKLVGVDASTFIQLKRDEIPTTYFKDKNAVYWFGKKIEGLKADSVKSLNESYIVDADSVFYLYTKISGADPATFVVFQDQDSWAKDSKAVYFREMRYPNIDASTLEILSRGYAKDKSKVYYLDGKDMIVVEGANPINFKVTNWDAQTKSEATDGAHFYLEGKAK
ncbi:MAG: DKNYY domain-containing protein [Bdellovibrionales bacterium]|nr:DKNYY domain-containing protein [Bdellovibrionales bacterium]